MKKFMAFTTSLIFLASCATHIPMSPEEVTKTYIIETNQKKNMAYSKMITFLGKSINNSNYAIKVQDKDLGKIVAKIKSNCPDKGNDINVNFNIDLAFKDNKAKFEIYFTGVDNPLNPNDIIQISIEGKEYAHRCINELNNQLTMAVNKKEKDW